MNISGGGAISHDSPTRSKSRRENFVCENPQTSGDKSQGTLTKRELAHAIYSVCPSISHSQAKKLVEAVLDEIVSTLAHGEEVNFRGFGKFAVRQKSERPGRNPKTGVSALIAARKVVTFKTSGILKAEVDGE
jgi:integration host factor subunit alpha